VRGKTVTAIEVNPKFMRARFIVIGEQANGKKKPINKVLKEESACPNLNHGKTNVAAAAAKFRSIRFQAREHAT
jgi:hypothetical protein